MRQLVQRSKRFRKNTWTNSRTHCRPAKIPKRTISSLWNSLIERTVISYYLRVAKELFIGKTDGKMTLIFQLGGEILMKKSFPKYCATFIALAGAGFVMLTTPAFAKMSNHKQANDKMDKIVVIGAPIERTRIVGRSEIGAPIEVIELRRQVSYADLDLKKYADVMKIKSRIQKVAKESC